MKDSDTLRPGAADAARLERYRRQEMVSWASHDRLKRLRVAVLGAGAVGNEVIKNLVLTGVGGIDIYDFDDIESHNLTRSVLFRETDVGLNKATVAASRATKIDPNVTLKAFDVDVFDALSIQATWRYDLIFACVDNFETRMRASLLCRLAGTDLISIGIDSRYVSVQRHPFSAQVDDVAVAGDATVASDAAVAPDAAVAGEGTVACYECDLSLGAYRAIGERYSCGWLLKAAADAKLVPTTAVTASVAAALGIGWALGNHARDFPNRATRLVFDTRSGHSTPTTIAANTACPACSQFAGPVVRGRFDGSIASLRNAMGSVDGLEFSGQEQHIVFSDPLIVSCGCTREAAHTEALAARVIGTAARRHNDTIAFCSACAESSVDIDIAESLTMLRWQQLFAEETLDCKFVYAVDVTGAVAVFDNDAVGVDRSDRGES